MKKPQVRSTASFIVSRPARVLTGDQLAIVAAGDGVLNTRIPQFQRTLPSSD
jgi:hypothetical protein